MTSKRNTYQECRLPFAVIPVVSVCVAMPFSKVMKTVTKRAKQLTFARLSPLAKGRIIGLREKGAKRSEIADRVPKKDGLAPSLKAIDNVLDRFEQEPEWDGCEHRTAGGRPRDVTVKQLESIRKILVREVGKTRVSATYVKRVLPELRRVPDRTIQRSFQRLGYAYLRRRGKQAIGEKFKPARLKYCDWLLKQDQTFLNKFAYVDGTTFYRPRTEEEQRDQERAALGPRGWRLEDGSDALEDKNVGASSYAKSQGKPIKIWGLFFNGRLEYWALPEETDAKGKKKSMNMTGARYHYFVTTFWKSWKRKCYPNFPKDEKVPLIKDYERFLRWGVDSDYNNLKAESDAGFSTVKMHPKSSPDFNAIEGWWRVLQERLSVTAPVSRESRADFLKRLRRTVTWLNDHARNHAKSLCTNQKARARAVKKLQGARCQW